jgi:sodium/hydrogen antiporter
MIDAHGWFEKYDILLLLSGLGLLLITLGRKLFERLNLNTTYVYLTVGLLAGPLLLDMAPEDALEAVPVLKRLAEAAVIISLIVLGIRIGRPISWSGWQSTVRLILIVMPATVAAVAAAGVWLLGLAFGPAVLLGAILAPTDPILAGPLEEESSADEAEERFGLSSEAGLNDGFAFPFVYLGLYLTLEPDEWRSWIGDWLLMDLLYAVALALPLGWVIGRICGRSYLKLMQKDEVSHKRRLFVPLALLLSAYGLVEMLGAYGFLAAFSSGLAFRRALAEADILDSFASFTESVDELTKAAVLLMVGALLPWAAMMALGWPLLGFALFLIVVIRPVVTLAATVGGGFERLHRVYWAWFGIRGIGSIYYLSYALDNGVEEPAASSLFAITVGTVLVSVLLHGLSVRPFLERFEGEKEVEE